MSAYPERPVVGVLAVVWRGDRVLLVQRANEPDAGKWGFPGGRQHLGETLAEAAMRELAEETGIRAAPTAVVTGLDVIDRDAAGRVRYHYVLVAVLAEWQDGEPVAADDALAAAWVDPDALAATGYRLSADVEAVIRLARSRRRQSAASPSVAGNLSTG